MRNIHLNWTYPNSAGGMMLTTLLLLLGGCGNDAVKQKRQRDNLDDIAAQVEVVRQMAEQQAKKTREEALASLEREIERQKQQTKDNASFLHSASYNNHGFAILHPERVETSLLENEGLGGYNSAPEISLFLLVQSDKELFLTNIVISIIKFGHF